MGNLKVGYTIVCHRIEDGWFMARAPEIPGAVTQGKDQHEAIEMIKEAVELLLASYQANATTSAEAMKIWEKVTKVQLPVNVPRPDLIRHIAKHGCHLDREGGKYSTYTNPNNGRFAAVPRDREIKETLTRIICDELGIVRL
jgi:predicted RNase H-like HicB family nuclease